MRVTTKIVCNDGDKRVSVLVKTEQKAGRQSRQDLIQAHHLRVDRVVEAVAHEFNYRRIKVS